MKQRRKRKIVVLFSSSVLCLIACWALLRSQKHDGIVCTVHTRDDTCPVLDPAEQWPSNALLCPDGLARLELRRNLSVAVNYRINAPNPGCCSSELLHKSNASCCDKPGEMKEGELTLRACPWVAFNAHGRPVYPRGPQRGGEPHTRCGIRQLLNATLQGVLSYDFVAGSALGSDLNLNPDPLPNPSPDHEVPSLAATGHTTVTSTV